MKLSHPKGEASAEPKRRRKVKKVESISNHFELMGIQISETGTIVMYLTNRECRSVRATMVNGYRFVRFSLVGKTWVLFQSLYLSTRSSCTLLYATRAPIDCHCTSLMLPEHEQLNQYTSSNPTGPPTAIHLASNYVPGLAGPQSEQLRRPLEAFLAASGRMLTHSKWRRDSETVSPDGMVARIRVSVLRCR